MDLVHILDMRIRLAKILLFIMTFSGISMTMHAYAHELTENQAGHAIEIETQNDDDSILCDHCCHFSSHSLGLMNKNSSVVPQKTKGILNFKGRDYTSYSLPPPYHPPIV